MISANGGLPAHRYTPQVTPRWPRGSEPASVLNGSPQPVLDCELGYCCICGIWLLFRVEGGLHFLYFWILDLGL